MTDNLLMNRDYTFIVAKSASKLTEMIPDASDRWEKAQAAIFALAQQCEALDVDGITLYINVSKVPDSCTFTKYENVRSAQLEELFVANQPFGVLNLADVLRDAFDHYFTRKQQGQAKPNGEIIIVATDGEPSDRMAIVKTILQATQNVENDEELGLGFVQVGDDAVVRGFLQALDDDLLAAGARFDIVHTQILEDIEANPLTQFLVDSVRD